MSSISSIQSGSGAAAAQYQAYLQRLQAAKTEGGKESPAAAKAENQNPQVDADHDGD